MLFEVKKSIHIFAIISFCCNFLLTLQTDIINGLSCFRKTPAFLTTVIRAKYQDLHVLIVILSNPQSGYLKDYFRKGKTHCIVA